MTIKYGLQFFFFFELKDNDGQNFLAGIVLLCETRCILMYKICISYIMKKEMVPGDQKGLFKLAVQLRKFYISVIYNTATGYVLLVYLTNI
jgi:hypothetical protein